MNPYQTSPLSILFFILDTSEHELMRKADKKNLTGRKRVNKGGHCHQLCLLKPQGLHVMHSERNSLMQKIDSAGQVVLRLYG